MNPSNGKAESAFNEQLSVFFKSLDSLHMDWRREVTVENYRATWNTFSNAREGIGQTAPRIASVLIPPIGLSAVQFVTGIRDDVENAWHLCRFFHCISAETPPSDPDSARIWSEMHSRIPLLRNSLWEAWRHIQHSIENLTFNGGTDRAPGGQGSPAGRPEELLTQLGQRYLQELLTPKSLTVALPPDEVELREWLGNDLVASKFCKWWPQKIESAKGWRIDLGPEWDVLSFQFDRLFPGTSNKFNQFDPRPHVTEDLLFPFLEQECDLSPATIKGLRLIELAQLLSQLPDPVNKRTGGNPKRPGRKKADLATVEKEAALAADWKRARDAGTYKGDFVRERVLTVAKLDALLDRVAKRNRPSE